MLPGDVLYPDDTTVDLGKIMNSTANLPAGVTASVARVVKGVSAAQAEATMDNTTLYPIRIKLLV